MAAPVTFDFNYFISQYGQFSLLAEPQAQAFFDRACRIFGNQQSNPAFGDGNLANCLYLLTAHIAWLNAPRDVNGNPAQAGNPPPPTVGRISSAVEGSVNVQLDMGDANEASPQQAWFLQTIWGAEFWAATAGYRTMVYAPRPTLTAATFLGRGPYRGGFR